MSLVETRTFQILREHEYLQLLSSNEQTEGNN